MRNKLILPIALFVLGILIAGSAHLRSVAAAGGDPAPAVLSWAHDYEKDGKTAAALSVLSSAIRSNPANTRGCMMPSRSLRFSRSANTTFASAFRSILPSEPSIRFPKTRTVALYSGVPGSSASCASTSASTTCARWHSRSAHQSPIGERRTIDDLRDRLRAAVDSASLQSHGQFSGRSDPERLGEPIGQVPEGRAQGSRGADPTDRHPALDGEYLTSARHTCRVIRKT